MNKTFRLIHSQQGSAMLAALMVFLVLSVLGTAIISIAGMEARMAINDAHAEQARQAADAGVQVGRDILLNHISSSQVIPDTINFDLHDNSKVKVIINADNIDTLQTVKIVSEGTHYDNAGNKVASKTAEAQVKVSVFPNLPVQTNSLSVVGRYVATVSSQDPNWLGELLNTQDWETVEYEYDQRIPPWNRYAAKGKPYDAFKTDFSSELPHLLFQPGNSNNSYNNRTWWIEYKHETKQLFGLEWDEINLKKSMLYVFPFWKPSGVLNVKDNNGNPATIAVRDWGSEVIGSNPDYVFDENVPSPLPALSNYPLNDININKIQVLPPKSINSADFIGQAIISNDYLPPEIQPNHLDAYRRLSQTNSDWQYIRADSPLLRPKGNQCYELFVDDPSIEKPRWFIDLPKEAKVILNFTTVIHNDYSHTGWEWLDGLVNDVLNEAETFFNTFYNQLDSITAVSPATLEVGYDSFIFQGATESSGKQPHIYLISGNDVNLYIEPSSDLLSGIARRLPNSGTERNVRTFILAGNNVNIVSTPEIMTFVGVISAKQGINIRMDYFEPHSFSLEDMVGLREIEKQVNIIEDPSIINDFPDPWHYIGIAPIVSYKYIN